jgi:hypothetical protein
MGDLQDAAKPIMIPLAMGKPAILDQDAQKVLASWACMAVITSEFDNPATVAVPESDRHWLWKNLSPPPDTWRIWIGHFKRSKEFVTDWVHHPMSLTEETMGNSSNSPSSPFNTQSTTFVIGEILIQVLSSSFAPVVSRWSFNSEVERLLTQIWPVVHKQMTWPLPHLLQDEDAIYVSGAFFSFIEVLENADSGFNLDKQQAAFREAVRSDWGHHPGRRG